MSKYVSFNKSEIETLLTLQLPEKIRKRLERALKPIKVRSAKQKGLGFQKWICQELSELIGEEYNQGDDSSPIQSRPGGQHGIDIILRGEAKKKFPFAVEAKNQENMNLMSTVAQAKANTGDYEDFLIIHKRKTLEKPIAVMEWDTFKKIWTTILEGEKYG